MSYLLFFIRETYRNLIENRVSVILAVISNAVALVIFGAFLLLFFNMNRVFLNIKDKVRIIGYISEDISIDDDFLKDFKKKIENNSKVLKIRYISKTEALKGFSKNFGDINLLEGFDKNPLPASFEVFIKQNSQSIEDLKKVEQHLAGLGIFSEIHYGKKWLSKLNMIMDYFNLCVVMIFLIVAFSTMIIISNITKLTLLMRKDEIKIMKHIGATNNIVRVPFILEGAFLGVMGGAISLVILKTVFNMFNKYIWQGGVNKNIDLLFIPSGHIWTIMILSIVVGVTATLFPLRNILIND